MGSAGPFARRPHGLAMPTTQQTREIMSKASPERRRARGDERSTEMPGMDLVTGCVSEPIFASKQPFEIGRLKAS